LVWMTSPVLQTTVESNVTHKMQRPNSASEPTLSSFL
jgi:hypothetical protein